MTRPEVDAHNADLAQRRTSLSEAIAAWEAKGPTSLTIALLADALYGASEALTRVNAAVDFLLATGSMSADQDARAFANAHALVLIEALADQRTSPVEEREEPTVCIAHGTFIPCRKDGEHRYTSNPYWVKSVRDYQGSPIDDLTWEPAWENGGAA